MNRSTLTATLLTFLMFLLVLVSAVVFLISRNRDLDQKTEHLVSEQSNGVSTRDQLESELVVLESAYDAALATRDASQDLVRSQVAELEAISLTATAQIGDLTRQAAEARPADPRLLIFAPKDGAAVRPLETITIYIAAEDEMGIDRVELIFNEGEVVPYPAGGLITFTLPVRWEVPFEGEHTISATAVTVDDRISETQTVTVQAEFQSESDRLAAEEDRALSELALFRFPDSTPDVAGVYSDHDSLTLLHLQLLTGMEAVDENSIYTTTLGLQALGYIPPGYDLGQYIQDMEENYYVYVEPGSDNVVMLDTTAEDGPYMRWTRIHPLTHRLQEEVFDMDLMGLNKLDGDRRRAVRAMIEGEAVLLQQLYLEGDTLEPAERQEIIQTLEGADSSYLDVFPLFLRHDFEFGYSAGVDFMRHLYEDGGFAMLDSVWRNPPISTAQILHPELYLAMQMPETAEIPFLDNLQGGDWSLSSTDTFGEFHLRQYLAQTLPPEQVEEAATGWAGGRYALYIDQQSEAQLLVIRLAWEQPQDREEFESAFTDFLNIRFSGEGQQQAEGGSCWEFIDSMCFFQLHEDTLVVRAPNLETATAAGSAIIPR